MEPHELEQQEALELIKDELRVLLGRTLCYHAHHRHDQSVQIHLLRRILLISERRVRM